MIIRAQAIDRDARKVFINYEQQEFFFPRRWKVIDYLPTNLETLDKIRDWTHDIEKHDLNHAIFTGTLYDCRVGKVFTREKHFFDPLGKTSIGQADMDGKAEGEVGFNDLIISARLDYLESSQRLLNSLAVFVQLSNKAFLPNPEYREKASARIWFQLTEPLTKKEWRKTFKPYFQKRGADRIDRFDPMMFSINSPHFIRPPLLIDSNGVKQPRPIIGDTTFYREGEKLDISNLVETDEWKRETANTDSFNNSISDSTDLEETKKVLLELAKDGYFEGNRHLEHFKLISKGIWVWRDAKPIIEFIDSERLILGEERDREGLEAEELGRHEYFREQFECYDVAGIPPLAKKKEWSWKNVIDELDLGNATLDDLKDYLESIQYKTVLNVQSAHGTGKTTGIIQRMRDWMTAYLGRPARIIYVCYRTSNVHQAAYKLGIPCYIEENGKIIAEFVATQEDIAICLHSLKKLYSMNHATGQYERHTFDLMILDESESNAMDANFDNGNHDYLIELAKDTTCIIQTDADLGELSFGYATAIAKKYGHQMSYLFNRATHIQGKTFNIIDSEIDSYLAIDGCLDNGNTVFAHTDFADPKLSAVANYFNVKHGKRIALAIDSKSKDLAKNIGIIKNPDTYLKAELEKGVRLFLVSPTIETGWRYGGSDNFDGTLFDTTIGIYTYARHTATQIIQASQRVVKATDHYLYAPRKSSYVDTDELEQQYHQATLDELQPEEKIVSRNKVIAELSYADLTARKADVKKKRQLSNVMLHLEYLIADYGAFVSYMPKLYDHKTDAALKMLVKEEEEELLNLEAHDIFYDPEKRANLEHFFYVAKSSTASQRQAVEEENRKRVKQGLDPLPCPYPGLDKNAYFHAQLNDIEDCLDLLKRRKKVERQQAETYELLHIALASPQERMSWGRQPYWKNMFMQEKSNLKAEKGTPYYTQYGAILDLMIQNIWEQTGVHLIKDLLLRKVEGIVIETELFKTHELIQLIDNWSDFLGSKVNTFRTRSAETTYLRRILEENLDLEVSTRTIKSGLATAKRNIILHYMEQGIIRKTKDLKVNTNIKIVHRNIKRKLASGAELDHEEEHYRSHTDKLMYIKLKPETSKNLFYSLYTAYTDPNKDDAYTWDRLGKN